jgi:PEGA domain-containing protein
MPFKNAVNLSLVLVFLIAGCATLASGTSQQVTFSANVDDAEVYLDGVFVGRTPFTGVVKKGKKNLRVEAAGYRDENVTLSRSLDPVFWGNIIIGGTLGSITDFATGAAYQYAPASYQVVLQKEGQTDASYSLELGVRKFATVYIDQISRDLSRGGGDYLDALVALSIAPEGSDLDSSVIRTALENSRGEPLAFGALVVESL